MMAAPRPPPDGIPIDAAGGPTIDPTKNVLQLVAAQVTRLDDLAAAEKRRIDDLLDARLSASRELSQVEHRCSEEATVSERRRLDDVLALTVKSLEAEARLRVEHETKLREAESKRIDAVALAEANRINAIIATSATAVAVASSEAKNQAELLRLAVENTAKALAAQLAVVQAALDTRISGVEKKQFEQQGAGVQRVESMQTSTAVKANQLAIWAMVVLFAAAIIAAGIGLATRGNSNTTPTITVPAQPVPNRP